MSSTSRNPSRTVDSNDSLSANLVRGRDLYELRDELEKVYLTELFRETGGDLEAMSSALRVNKATLYRWFKTLGLDVRTLREGRKSD